MHQEKMTPDCTQQYDTVAQAIAYLQANAAQQPSLEQVAAAVQVSPCHLQRVFSQWAGLSPKRFVQFMTKEYAKRALLSGDVLSVSAAAGLSSPSRLHDLMVSCEAMTPGEYKTQGRGMRMGFGFASTPFGQALLAWTGRGICHFAFCTADPEALCNELKTAWPLAELSPNDAQAQAWAKEIFPPTLPSQRKRIHLLLKGTNFQIKVWEALIQASEGRVISYQQLAHHLGTPGASRAVGTALSANTIGYLIPCHRVIRSCGDIANYRWGRERKVALLMWELDKNKS